jgi:acyl-CoA thioesterase I
MRICFIGDSFVNGTGDDDYLGWVGRLCSEARQRGTDVTAYNLGIRRDTSADIAARWLSEAKARLPLEQDGRLVFSFGANDCVCEHAGRPRVPPDDSMASAAAILGAAKVWLPTLMIGPPPLVDREVNRRIASLSARIAALCGELGVPFLSPFEALLGSGVWIGEAKQGDGAHPNRGGYAILADLVSQWPAWRAWQVEG